MIRAGRARVLTACVVLAVVAAVVLVVLHPWDRRLDENDSSSQSGRAAASTTALGYSAQSAAMGDRSRTPSRGWRSNNETVGAWLAVSWPHVHSFRSVTIKLPKGSAPNVTAGTLSFGDGSALQVMLSRTSRTTTVPITPRTARWIRFTAFGFASGATATTIARFAVNESDIAAVRDHGGDAAATATVETSSGFAGGGLVKGGKGWATDSGLGSRIRFTWPKPRELVSISVAGATGSKATIASATLQFDGGGSVQVGAVLRDPSLPTTVAFLPRVVRGATLVIRSVDGTGPLQLTGVELQEQGHAARAITHPVGATVDAPGPAPCGASPASASTLQVLCPENGSRVGDTATLVVTVPPGASGIAADVWPASGRASVATRRASGTGAVRLPLQFEGLPDGPITVRLVAIGSRAPAVLFQLLHGQDHAASLPTSRTARGRTLVYDDEFDGPVSASRSGAGARYAAGKPEAGSVTDFGDAIFAGPEVGLGNLGTLDDDYLRLAVSPKPAGYTDPLGWNRKSIGGLLASARPGGSGVSAQYGYFETRMLAPAAPGTWPAFWLLPASNLVRPQREVAEFDAVELYGHDPQGACQTTHEYTDGKDGGSAACGKRFSSARAAAQWHTYAVNVTPTGVLYFIDGRRVASMPQVRGGADPMFFLVDLALGGGWPVQLAGTQGRAQLLVDYVRVYV